MAHLEETHFHITRGDGKSYRVTVLDDEGVAVDITGMDIRAEFRKRPHSPAIIAKEIGAGITVEDGPAGVFRIDILPADTAALGNWRQAYGYDVQVTNGEPVTVARGTLTIEPDYTQ